jgi:hypothetical protein
MLLITILGYITIGYLWLLVHIPLVLIYFIGGFPIGGY